MKRIGLVLGLALSIGIGGVASTAFAASNSQSSLITLDMLSVHQGWAINTRGQVLQTTDGGHRWKNVASSRLTNVLQRAAAITPGDFNLSSTAGGDLIGNDATMAFPNPWTAWITIREASRNQIQVWHTSNGGRQWASAIIHRAAPRGGMGESAITALGNHDAWIVAATQGLTGHVDFRVWRISVRHRHWHAVFQGSAPNTAGMVFATGAIGILAEGSNIIDGPRSAALAVTSNGGPSWAFTGGQTIGETSLPQTSALPLLPGSWATTVLDPIVVPHTQSFIVAVLMQKPFPSKIAPLKTWWRLEASSDGGHRWNGLPTTPDSVLASPPNLIMQTWVTPQIGWVMISPSIAHPQTSSAQLYRTINGGHRWTSSALLPGTVVNINQVSPTEGFVLMQQGPHTTIYRTQDGGLHWAQTSPVGIEGCNPSTQIDLIDSVTMPNI